MPVTHIKIPQKCLQLNPKFNKHEQRLIVASMLLQINLPIFRADKLRLNIRHLGVIKTHGNKKKKGIAKYVKRYNKSAWKKQQNIKKFSEKYLLF